MKAVWIVRHWDKAGEDIVNVVAVCTGLGQAEQAKRDILAAYGGAVEIEDMPLNVNTMFAEGTPERQLEA